MIEVKNELVIHKSRNEIFNFITHFENIPLWNYYVKSVEKVSPDSEGLGTIYHQTRKNDEQEFKISEFNPPGSVTIETIGNSSPQFKRTMTLSERNDQTHLMDIFKVNTGSPNMVERLLKNRIESAVLDNLTSLKDLLEKGNTVLPDGRSIHT
jgi:uncharacterized membrane protein